MARMKITYRRQVALCSLAIGLFYAPTAWAHAADSAQSEGDIIVTAQKRSERLSDVPLSITAVTGEQLRSAGVTSTADLERIVPGFTAQQSAYGPPVFTIRGIGFYDTSTGVSPTVSVYVDQVPLPYSVMTPGASLDLERVEVLKGPQGTLFGQNSTGGAINYIAAKPTDELEAGGSLTYGRFNQFDVDGYVSGPLADGVKARLAIRHEDRDDWQYSQTRDDTLGRRNFTVGRLLLDVEPSDALALQFNLNGWIDKSDSQAAQFLAYAPTNPMGFPEEQAFFATAVRAPNKARVADWDPGVDFRHDDRFYQASLRADLALSSDVTLTSITAYTDFRGRNPNDSDGVSFNDLFFFIKSDIDSFSQELRLAGETSGLKWMIGGNYQSDTANEDQLGHEWASNSGIATPAFVSRYRDFVIRNDQEIKTAAVFASLDYEIVPTLTIQGSIRYTDQRRKANGCLLDAGDGALATAFGNLYSLLQTIGSGVPTTVAIPNGGCVTSDAAFNPVTNVPGTLNEDNLAWRAGLSWKPSNGLLLYANATKGYKAGSFAGVPSVSVAQYIPVTQESVLAYEAGFKASLFDRHVTLEGAAFYYDYHDKQILGFVNTGFPFGTLPKLLNVPTSRVAGFELSTSIRPATGLSFRGAVSYIDSKVTRSYLTPAPYGAVIDLKGEGFPNTPRWQISGGFDYETPVSGAIDAFFGGDVNYRSKSVAAFGSDPLFAIDGYALVNLRAGIKSNDDRWRAELWGRNITNKYYWNGVSHVIDSTSRVAGMPSTYGVTVSFRY
jgi:iron complex outermembrane receptor protein